MSLKNKGINMGLLKNQINNQKRINNIQNANKDKMKNIVNSFHHGIINKKQNRFKTTKNSPEKFIFENSQNNESKIQNGNINLGNNNNNLINNNNDNNKIIPKVDNKDIELLKKEFKKPPLRGLKNVGATCYMNATIQCLSQIDSLVSYFKYHKTVENVIDKYKKKNCLTKSFKILIENLWPTSGNKYIKKKYLSKNSNNIYFIPEEFKEKIIAMNPLFKTIQANDATELVNFIIITLHEELNRYKDCNPNNNNNIKNFSKENKSIITDKFIGISHTVTKCSKCLIDKHNFETYFFLDFPLEEIRKYKL